MEKSRSGGERRGRMKRRCRERRGEKRRQRPTDNSSTPDVE
jgi:hypothetical protein